MDQGPLAMVIVVATGGDCTWSPSLKTCIFLFGTVTLLQAFLKFCFYLGRDGAAGHFKIANGVVQLLGIVQLFSGLWAAFLTFPNLQYLSGPGSGDEVCPFSVYLCAFIPAVIIAAVVVGLICYGAFYAVTRRDPLGM